MTAVGTAVSWLLLRWCVLLYVPLRWRPVGVHLFPEKVLAPAHVPW